MRNTAERNERLRVENDLLRREIEELQEASAITRATYEQRFWFVATLRGRLKVRPACQVMRVKRSSYYAWLARCRTYRRRSKVPSY
jgi:hypothetical protein